MEKDKFRSVIMVGLLACSILLVPALFVGCPGPKSQPTWQSQLQAAQMRCPHPTKTAYYHHTYTIPPHHVGMATVTWCAPSTTTGTPSPQPCPTDTMMCACDSVKCAVCGAKLWP
jgi:hypothetical protein